MELVDAVNELNETIEELLVEITRIYRLQVHAYNPKDRCYCIIAHVDGAREISWCPYDLLVWLEPSLVRKFWMTRPTPFAVQSGDTCFLCTTRRADMRLPCGHQMDFECWSEWALRKHDCPYCRAPF